MDTPKNQKESSSNVIVIVSLISQLFIGGFSPKFHFLSKNM